LQPILSLAPLHGVSNRVFREAFFAHFSGFDHAVAPFILAVKGAAARPAHFKDLLPEHTRGTPIVPQILGNEPESFLETAAVIGDLGYAEVDWNLGCPYPMVANKMRGSGLLPHPERIRRFLDDVFPRLRVGLSVKVRLGRYDPGELRVLAPIFNAFPLTKVIIHPRIGTQMYEGVVDLEGFAAAVALLDRPVVYNGDIRDPDAFSALRSRFPFVREWMIGRGALSDPFLPARLKGLSLPERPLSAIAAFHADLYGAYRELLCGPTHVLDKMKEVWSYLSASVPDSAGAFKAISRAKTLDAYEAAVGAALEGPA
jgi:tRNA-dihydrouridine synthase